MPVRLELFVLFFGSPGGIRMLIGMFSLINFFHAKSPEQQNRKGLTGRQVEFAVRQYHSHRRIGAHIMMDLGVMNNPE